MTVKELIIKLLEVSDKGSSPSDPDCALCRDVVIDTRTNRYRVSNCVLSSNGIVYIITFPS